MKLHRTHRRTMALAAAMTLTVSLAACGDNGGDDAAGGGDAAGDGAEGGAEGGGETITLGFIPSWTDGLSTAYLLEDQLEEAGFTVEMEEISEAGPLFAALAEGDVDIYPSAWPEVTHASYMEEYGDQLEDLGAYYEEAKLTFAVPEYVDIDSIEDLQGNADMFGGQIVGIEPGAGLTQVTKESVIPGYDLGDSYTLVESSTTAMLAELESAIDAEEDIVVTLWRPFWANSAYPVKDLEDPEGALGEAESLNFIATAGFSEEFPDVAEMIGGIQLDDEQYGALEDSVVNEFPDDPAAGVDAWLEEYPDVLPSMS